jgi:hypothetical protein
LLILNPGSVIQFHADWDAGSVIPRRQGAAGPKEHPVAEWFTMPGMVFDPDPERVIGEGDHAENRILAGCFHLGRHVCCPLLIEAPRPARVPPDAGWMKEAREAKRADRFAKEGEEHVRIVDAGIECDRAGRLLVPPRSDEDTVPATHGRLHDELGLADRAVGQQSADKPVHRVLTKILGHVEQETASLGRRDHVIAPADG